MKRKKKLNVAFIDRTHIARALLTRSCLCEQQSSHSICVQQKVMLSNFSHVIQLPFLLFEPTSRLTIAWKSETFGTDKSQNYKNKTDFLNRLAKIINAPDLYISISPDTNKLLRNSKIRLSCWTSSLFYNTA